MNGITYMDIWKKKKVELIEIESRKVVTSFSYKMNKVWGAIVVTIVDNTVLHKIDELEVKHSHQKNGCVD